MRAIAPHHPTGSGKRRFLESCAIGAGLAALACGGPVTAQVAGTGQVITGSATISPPAPGAPPNTTQVVTTTNQTIINWVPTDTAPTGGAIDFLPAGNTLEYYGTGQYVVLNRFVSGAGTSLSRQVALNGTVNGYVTIPGLPAVQGGNIWFYNAGGILIGNGAAINVGSLLLSANDIDTTGGLFGPGGEIRFRGAAGSTSAVQVAAGASINATTFGNPGGSYVALVAPRVVQAGAVRVDGSAAYVAAEQADVRINGGLFDIDVLVGAEGGNVIDHSGTTTGPAHQQDDTDQSRIYMVAIPKNDAVTMLVAGQVGYDDAITAQTDPDGRVVLSAGYDIVGGDIGAAPDNATAANITVSDTIFRSDTIAHASGAFLGQPLTSGTIAFQGDATLIGDASATLAVDAGQTVGATADLNIQSGGTGGAPGNVNVNVTGGQLAVVGNLNLVASGVAQLDGSSVGGTAGLSITGGNVQAGAANVSSIGTGGIGAGGDGGDGAGGDAAILVSGAGSTLTADAVAVQSTGTGGGLIFSGGVAVDAADNGGNGVGGNATLTVENGANLSVNTVISIGATGIGQTGVVQSGTGTGGVAQLVVSGAGTSITAGATSVSADGFGGANYAQPLLPDILTQNGGGGIGGTASLIFTGDSSSSAGLGGTTVSASGMGGGASADENVVGGAGQGGSASVTADGGMVAEFDQLAVQAMGQSGGGVSPSGLTALSGDAQGGTITIGGANDGFLTTDGDIFLNADGVVAVSENLGSGTGGDIAVTATTGGSIRALDGVTAQASGGSESSSVAASTGSGTGGDIAFVADGGSISALYYSVRADGNTVNVTGTGGIAQGGTVDFLASNTGLIETTDPGSVNDISANGQSGVSAGGVAATGGTIQLIANAGTINLDGATFLSAAGVAGGDSDFGAGTVPVGQGGNLLLRTVAEPTNSSTLIFGDLYGQADGSSSLDVEGGSGSSGAGAANGHGGDVLVDIQGGSFAVSSSAFFTADGYGGAVGANSGTGQGGTATFTQTGGDTVGGDLYFSADGFGAFDPSQSGNGVGGTTTINLLGGTLSAADVTASATGFGGIGAEGDDFDPVNPIPAGNGGDGQGGSTAINIDGTAVVTVGTLTAYATGEGGEGGTFSVFSGTAGDGGDGGAGTGGNATINMLSGTLTASSVTVDAGAVGGNGGSMQDSGSSGPPTGTGVGGVGGGATGGTATLNLATDIQPGAAVLVASRGDGGDGGYATIGGDGGDGMGGTAQILVTNYNAGNLLSTIDAGSTGGDGGYGDNGSGGDGGDGIGGIARVQADGAGSQVRVDQENFISGGLGGNGGSANAQFGSGFAAGPRGGDGGDGTGGTLEVIANDGAMVRIGPDSSEEISLSSMGSGGNGGDGAFNSYGAGTTGGDGGDGGDGSGGTVHLLVNGGTLTTIGEPVTITVGGVTGSGGSGGTGTDGDGAGGVTGGTAGGRAVIEAYVTAVPTAQIALGDTIIHANGNTAGRIEFISDGTITMTSLNAEALGVADPTNSDTDVAASGIFFGAYGGTIQTPGAATLTTGGSVGIYAQAGGQLDIGSDLVVDAGDQVDIRHDFGDGTATIQTGGSAAFTAVNTIRSAPGSLVSAGTSLTMTTTGINNAIDVDSLAAQTSTLLQAANNGRINVYGTTTSGDDLTANASGEVAIANASAGDDIDLGGGTLVLGTLVANANGADADVNGSNIILASTGAATVEHGEADNDFTANVGSFATGLNSIITGGDIDITSVGAVDLGNSTAGGFVSVTGTSIDFANIDAGSFVGLTASGALTGGSIDTDGYISLSAAQIAIDGVVTGGIGLFANGSAGSVGINLADIDGDISVSATGDITGTYDAAGNIYLNSAANIDAAAHATGFQSSSSGPPMGASVYADAVGNLDLHDSSAAGMVGAHAGGSASLTNTTAGEDMLIIAGTTATLDNLSAGDDLSVLAGGNIVAAALVTTGAGPDLQTLVYDPNFSGFYVTTATANGSNIDLTSTAGNVGLASANAFDNLNATAAAGTISSTGLLQSGLATSLDGNQINVTAITAATDIVLASNTGITATGALAAGRDLSITAANGVNISELDAGDDIRVDAGAALTIGAAYTYGTGTDSEGDGSNIVLAGGATNVTHAEAVGDFTATATSFTTGTASIITGGNIDISAGGAVDLGNSSAGGFVSVTGASIGFVNIVAGSTVGLNAVTSLAGGTIDAGGDINLIADDIAITGPVTGGASLYALGFNGDVAIDQADVAGSISIFAGGDLTGAYGSGGNITLTADGDVDVQAVATGGFVDPNGIGTEGYVFVDGDGSVLVANSSAATMFGVRAGQDATVTDSVTGEDMVVLAASTASLANVTAGDDLTVTAAGGIDAAGASTTGTGPDDRTLTYGPLSSSGSDAFQISATAPDLSNIVFTASAGDIDASAIGAFDNLTMTASGTVTTSGGVASGRATSITASDMAIEAITAGTDIDLTALTGGIASTGTGAIAAGGNVSVVAAGAADLGNTSAGGAITADAQSIAFAALDAGDTVDLTANGTANGAEGIDGATIVAGGDINLFANSIGVTGSITGGASLFATGTGGSVAIAQATLVGNIAVSAVGDVTGGYTSGGDIVMSSDANIVATANASGGFPDPANGDVETAGNAYFDAAGNVVLSNSSAADMLGVNAGGSASLSAATAGEDILVIAGTTAALSNVSAGDDIDVRAAGAVTASNVSATGAGPDGFMLNYASGSGFTIGMGEGSSSLDGADIDIASSGGAINAADLSAGDDILLSAATTLGLAGATTLGLGITGGDSSIRTQSGNATIAGIDSFSDVVISSTGTANIEGTVAAGRDVAITGDAVTIADLETPAGDPVNTVAADRDIMITSANDISGGSLLAQGDMTLAADGAIDLRRVVTGGDANLSGAAGVTAAAVETTGTTTLASSDGAIAIGSLLATGEIDARGDSIRIDGGGDMIFTNLIADTGDAFVRAGGELAVVNASVAGRAELRNGGEGLAIDLLTADSALLEAESGSMRLGNVSATGALDASALGSITIAGTVTGRSISLASADIIIGSDARVGTGGTTEDLMIANNDNSIQTFVGGDGSGAGYNIDADELTRIYGTQITIFAPQLPGNDGGFVASAGGTTVGTIASIGSSARPDVIIDDFTMTGGGSTSNLGANGSLTIRTPGKARVIGDVQLTGLSDDNAFNIVAGDAIEVILGDGSIRLTGADSATPGGHLNLSADDVIVATLAAIADVSAATSTDDIENRLAQNDGVTSDDGALFARGIDVDVLNGFYVQNSGAGTDFDQRRGMTFGAGGLNVQTGGSATRLVLNGVQLGPQGQITGLDTVALLSINGGAPAVGEYEARSTLNGCLIANPAACGLPPVPEIGKQFPVQDVIEEETNDDGEGNGLPTPLITLREIDPLSGEPLLDDPVTGAGNDDLWTPPSE